MFKPNIIDGVLTSRFDEIKTHLNHQLSFSPYSNKGHIMVNNKFHEFEVDEKGDLYSPSKIKGYDYFKGKSYLGNYKNMKFSPYYSIIADSFDEEGNPISGIQFGISYDFQRKTIADSTVYIRIDFSLSEEDFQPYEVYRKETGYKNKLFMKWLMKGSMGQVTSASTKEDAGAHMIYGGWPGVTQWLAWKSGVIDYHFIKFDEDAYAFIYNDDFSYYNPGMQRYESSMVTADPAAFLNLPQNDNMDLDEKRGLLDAATRTGLAEYTNRVDINPEDIYIIRVGELRKVLFEMRDIMDEPENRAYKQQTDRLLKLSTNSRVLQQGYICPERTFNIKQKDLHIQAPEYPPGMG